MVRLCLNAGDSETEDCALAGSSQLVGMLSQQLGGSTWFYMEDTVIETCEFENPRAVQKRSNCFLDNG
jgi:hypothetical protein